MKDRKDYSLAFFRAVFDHNVKDQEISFAMSDFEVGLHDRVATDGGDPDPFSPLEINNIGLIVATMCRSASLRERLAGIRAESGQLIFTFDFLRSTDGANQNISFEISLSREEAVEILKAEFPFVRATRLTDTRIQHALCRFIPNLE